MNEHHSVISMGFRDHKFFFSYVWESNTQSNTPRTKTNISPLKKGAISKKKGLSSSPTIFQGTFQSLVFGRKGGSAGIGVFAAPLPRSVRGGLFKKRAVERGQPFKS